MALDANAKKTEHNGAKNMGHDKASRRESLKDASNKRRRVNDRLAVHPSNRASECEA